MDNHEAMHQASRRAHQWLRLAALDDEQGIDRLRAKFTVADYVWISAVLASLTEGFLRALGSKADPEAVQAHQEVVDQRDRPAREVDWSTLAELQVAIVDRLSAQKIPDATRRAKMYGMQAGISYRAGQ